MKLFRLGYFKTYLKICGDFEVLGNVTRLLDLFARVLNY